MTQMGQRTIKRTTKKKELNKRKFALVKFLYVSTSLLKQFYILILTFNILIVFFSVGDVTEDE